MPKSTMAGLCVIYMVNLIETARQFSVWLHHFTFAPAMDSVAPKPGQHTGLLIVMIDGQWYLTVP